MSWILLCVSSLVAVGTWNALWPGRRPWWLKLASFNAGWFVNELPLHVLAGHAGPPSGAAATIRACVAFYGPYDFDNRLGLRPPGEMRVVERFVVKASRAENPTLYERASPLAQVHRNAPPFLVVQGTSDNLVFLAESAAFIERLRCISQAVVAYVEVPRGHHAFDVFPSVRTGHVIAGVDRFLSHIYSLHRPSVTSSTSDRAAGSGAR